MVLILLPQFNTEVDALYVVTDRLNEVNKINKNKSYTSFADYNFYPNLDSFGHDIKYMKNENILELKKISVGGELDLEELGVKKTIIDESFRLLNSLHYSGLNRGKKIAFQAIYDEASDIILYCSSPTAEVREHERLHRKSKPFLSVGANEGLPDLLA